MLAEVSALDARRAVAVGLERRDLPGPRGPVALYTDDGGLTWKRSQLNIADPERFADVQLRSVCLAPNGIGLAIGFGEELVLVTRNGGISWDDVTSLLPASRVADAACSPDGRLWCLGAASTVRSSDDGGLTWQDRSGNLPLARVRRGAFLGDGIGWIATSDGISDTRLRIFLTRDDGSRWQLRYTTADFGELTSIGLDALDDRRAIVVTQESRPLALPRSSFGRSFATDDGGEHWTVIEHLSPIDALVDVDLIP